MKTLRHPQVMVVMVAGVAGVAGVAALSAGALGCAGGSSDVDGGSDGGGLAGPPSSSITHLVVILQQDHTFDAYFGNYCTAPSGSNPTCTVGPACCESVPSQDPGSGVTASLFDDTTGNYVPQTRQACELEEMDGMAMDRYVTGSTCGATRNFAVGSSLVMQGYWNLAATSSLADRWYQPVVGSEWSNAMYLARAGFVFLDDNVAPRALGRSCDPVLMDGAYTDRTIGDLLTDAGVTWAVYAEGYTNAHAAQQEVPPTCGTSPSDCQAVVPAGSASPCVFDPARVPFEYYTRFRDQPDHVKDLAALGTDLNTRKLPSVSFVRGLGYHSEAAAQGVRVSDGLTFVSQILQAVSASTVSRDTLVLVTWDQGGGYFDHVSPPTTSTVDHQPYGTRVPAIAVGPFAKENKVSHVPMEHASIVKFIEWNFLGKQTGQLGQRDAVVNNIGSLLDPAATGTPVPSF